jgi:ABC-2 type transport system permease protein
VNSLTGTLTLTRLALRRDWLRTTLWVIGLAVLMALMASAVRGLVATDEGTVSFVRLYVLNPVMRMFGLASGATIGAFTLTRVYIMFAILVAIVSIFSVTRNTRANEDLGRTELLGSLPIGRHAGLASAIILGVGANLLLAVLIAIGLLLNGLDAQGSMAAGASIGALGIAFVAVAAVTAQLADNSRKANGLAAIIMGITALLSSIGNIIGRIDEANLRVEPAWPAWLSPFGWGQLMRPYDTNNWWLIAIFLLFFIALVALAFFLESRRDVGQGILPQRRGRPTASWFLSHTPGLAWRQQRGVYIGWTLALVAIGVVYGLVANEMEAIMEDMEEAREIFEQMGGTDVIIDGYFSATTGIIGMLTAVYVIQSVLRTRHEELHGPLEGLLSTATSRKRWLNAHLLIATAGAFEILLLSGIAMGIATGLVLHDVPGWTLELTLATLSKFPAVLVLAALTALAFGALPRRATLIAWGLFFLALLIGPMFGPLLDLPQWAMDISPFTHVAGPPAEEIDPIRLAALLAIATGLWLLAMVFFSRRDLELH